MLRPTYVTPGWLPPAFKSRCHACPRPSIHDSARTKTNRPYLIRILIFMPPTPQQPRTDDETTATQDARSVWRHHR